MAQQLRCSMRWRVAVSVVIALTALAAVPAIVRGDPADGVRNARDGGGLRIGFQSDRGSADLPFQQIFSMGTDGSDVRPLLPASFDNSFDVAFSPDGRRFAFTTILDPGYFELHVASVDGTRIARLTNNIDVHDAGPAWSPDGGELAFVSDRTGNFDVHLLSLRRPSAVFDVTRNPANDCACYDPFNVFAAPSFSPDGRRIAFTSDLAAPEHNVDVYVINRDGINTRRLTSAPEVDAEPDWSPNGRWIAFQRASADGASSALYVMNARGGALRQLTHDNANNRQPAWSPDGRKIAYSSNLGGSYDIWLMNADGSNPQNLTHDAAYDERPAWQPSDDHADGDD
jgi:Tol biopolymer transport system component